MKVDFPSEKFIEDYVYERSLEDGECIISGDAIDKIWRQLAIPGYGTTDIVKAWFIPKGIELTVLELKNEPLKEVHLTQLARYMTGLKSMVDSDHGDLTIDVYGQLAGPFDAERGDFAYMLNCLPRQISAFELKLDMEEGFSVDPISENWRSRGESEDWFQGKLNTLYLAHHARFEELNQECRQAEEIQNPFTLAAVK